MVLKVYSTQIVLSVLHFNIAATVTRWRSCLISIIRGEIQVELYTMALVVKQIFASKNTPCSHHIRKDIKLDS